MTERLSLRCPGALDLSVLTIGKPCINKPQPSHSQQDTVEFDNTTGFILNNWAKDGGTARIAQRAALHQLII